MLGSTTTPDMQSIIFGFVFFAIFVAFLSGAYAWQRWSSARRRLQMQQRAILLSLANDVQAKGERPLIWDVYVRGGAGTDENGHRAGNRWRDVKPFAAHLLPAAETSVIPTTAEDTTSPRYTSLHAQHPPFFTLRPRETVEKNVEKSADILDDPTYSALEVAVLISMPVHPELRRRSADILAKRLEAADADSIDIPDEPVLYEIGVAEVQLCRT